MATPADYETGIYCDSASAEDAVKRLHAGGYAREDISVMMDHGTRDREFPNHDGIKSAQGTATGWPQLLVGPWPAHWRTLVQAALPAESWAV